RQAEQLLAPVAVRSGAVEHAGAREAGQDATEVAGVQVERAGELGGGGGLAVRQLVQHAHLGERERTAQVAVLQDANAAGVQTVEAADGVDVLLELARAGCSLDRLARLAGARVDMLRVVEVGGAAGGL